MIIKVEWEQFKTCKDSTGNLIFYHVENEYSSNDPNIDDIQRYFLEMTINSDTLNCFLTMTTPKNADQIDFENNYKDQAILVS